MLNNIEKYMDRLNMDKLWNPMQQLVNDLNFGNRVIDSLISIVLFVLLELICKYLYAKITSLYFEENSSTRSNLSTGPNPWDFNVTSVECDTLDNIQKYKFCLQLDSSDSECVRTKFITNELPLLQQLVHLWIENTLRVVPMRLNQTTVYCVTTNYKIKFMTNGDNSNDGAFMPIWKYKSDNKIEYIYIHNKTIWSNSNEELLKFTDHFFNYVKTNTTTLKIWTKYNTNKH